MTTKSLFVGTLFALLTVVSCTIPSPTAPVVTPETPTTTNNTPTGAASTPTFSPVAGTYSNSQSVSITCTTANASIFYTLDGSTPNGSSTLYTGPILQNVTGTIKAIAKVSGLNDSTVGSASYSIGPFAAVLTPTFSPIAGTYSNAQSVTISCGTSSASIYYSTDGSVPTSNSSAYSSPITVSSNMTINALATKTGLSNSTVGSASFAIEIPTPSYTPPGGTYTNSQSVTLSCSIPGSSIFYSTDGSTPSSNSIVYLAPISITSNTTIRAFSSKAGFNNSAVANSAYVISIPPTTVSTPTISPNGGTFTNSKSVSISCTTPGAAVYYTIDGSTPTASSTLYTSPFLLSLTSSVKAIGIKAGLTNSSIVNASFSIPRWQVVGLPGFSSSGVNYTSIALNSGTPFVAYADTTLPYRANVKKYNGTSWVDVGTPGLSVGSASYLSIGFIGTTPYIGFSDGGRTNRATVMSFNGSSWNSVGIPGFTSPGAPMVSFACSSTAPYIAFNEGGASLSVMTYNGSSWVYLGSSNFSPGGVMSISLVMIGTTPYVAFEDAANSLKLSVMTFNGTSWVNVGSPGISVGQASYISISASGTTPYVSFTDAANSSKASLMMYNGSSWVYVGNAGFSPDQAPYTTTKINASTPFVAFMDVSMASKATVMYFTGTSWETLGSPGFSAGVAGYNCLCFDGTTPYLAFKDGGNGDTATVFKFSP